MSCQPTTSDLALMSFHSNPYAPSASIADRQALLDRVSGPALGLMISSGIWVAILLVSAAFSIGLIATGMADQMRQPMGMTKETQIIIRTIFGFLLMGFGGLTIYGAYCLKSLSNRSMAVTAIVLSLIPCTSACYIVGIGFGVWALVVVMQPEVWDAFQEPRAS